MPQLDHSTFIKGTSAKYNGAKGNLLLSADGLWFIPDDGGSELHIPIEKIMDASLEGVVRKKVSVVVNGSNERHIFTVSDFDEWRASITLAAGIYRRVVTGTSGTSGTTGSPGAGGNTTSKTKKSAKPAQKKSPSSPKQPATGKKKAAAPQPPPTQTVPQTQQTGQQTSTPPSMTAVGPSYNGPWPSGQDYEQSFQMMKLSISKKVGDIASWEAVKNPKTPGWYVYASGNYGSIYKIKDENDRFFALKCFTRKSGNINERYLKISDYLSKNSNALNFLAHFRYYQDGIKTRKNKSYLFPLLKMEWMDGVTLNKYIDSHINEPKILRKISENLVAEIGKLQSAGISHGDLAGDNIIINNGGDVKLVDYDGMFIPDFKGQRSTEMGHADFQHPSRNANSFSEKLDNFSALVIHLSLTALSLKPDLWDRYNGDDPDCLILRKKDFMNLDVSPAFNEMMKIRNKKVKKMCNLLKDYVTKDALWDGASPSILTSL